MNKGKSSITRRDFVRGAVGMTLMGAAGWNLARAAEGFDEEGLKRTAKVVLVRDRDVLDINSRPNPEVLQSMLDDAVCALLDESNPVKAWEKLVKPTDIVGIKSNVWRFLPTPPDLEAAIVRRLKDVGVSPKHIGIDDRRVLRNPIFEEATALINVRPLRTHNWSGVGGCIKNVIMFSPNPSAWHGDSCADLGGLFRLPIIKDKSRLHILVMLTPLYHGKGPHHFQKKYTWEYKGLLVSTDPVAVDATGVRILTAKRREVFGEDLPFTVSTKHIKTAEAKFNLGVADPSRIELVKRGWMEGALI